MSYCIPAMPLFCRTRTTTRRFSASVCGSFVYLAAFSHCAGGQHVGQRDMTLLKKDVGDIVGPLFAELLIQGSTARCDEA